MAHFTASLANLAIVGPVGASEASTPSQLTDDRANVGLSRLAQRAYSAPDRSHYPRRTLQRLNRRSTPQLRTPTEIAMRQRLRKGVVDAVDDLVAISCDAFRATASAATDR